MSTSPLHTHQNAAQASTRKSRIARRKGWNTLLAGLSGSVLVLVALILLALFADVFCGLRDVVQLKCSRGASMAWTRAEMTVDIAFPASNELYVDGPAYRTQTQGLLSARQVRVETRPIILDQLIGSREIYDAQIVASVEQITGLSAKNLTARTRGKPPIPEAYVAQIGGLFIDPGAYFKERIVANPDLAGTSAPYAIAFSTDADAYLRGYKDLLTNASGDIPQSRMSPFQQQVLDELLAAGAIKKVWNWSFLTNAYPQNRKILAGIGPAIQASLLMMAIVILISLPVGVGGAIFLEFFAPRQGFLGWLTTVIEININNLASVPSIVFGLMGLAIFVQAWGPIFIFDTGLATPIVGGLILSLMTLPTIVVTSRAALLAVPPSFQQAAYGIGATRMQTIFRFVLPYAFPGILTGVIIGIAQAIGETAPLVVIGMVAAEVVTCSDGLLCLEDPSPALPTAISYFRRFMDGDQQMVSRAYMTIVVLLAIVLSMNSIASIIRARVARSRQG